jgi:flavin-dependent dehydrogenase
VIGADSETVSVSLEGGETLSADVVVGADGYDSLVRGVVTGKKDEGMGENHLIITYTIPASLLEADDELRHLRSSTVVSGIWLMMLVVIDVGSGFSGHYGWAKGTFFMGISRWVFTLVGLRFF